MRAWLLQIVRHTCYSWLKENRPAERVTLDDDDALWLEGIAPAADEPDAAALRSADRAQLDQAIAALPIAYREVLVLRELEDLAYKDIARIADIPLGTVMSRLARARSLLRQALRPGARPLLRPVASAAQARGTVMKSALDMQREWQRLNAFVDGELDLTRQLEIEAQIERDAALRAEVDGLRRLREAVRERAGYHAAPAALRARFDGLAAAPVDAAARVRSLRAAWRALLRRWFAWRPMALALGLAALLAWGLSMALLPPERDERLMQEAIASQVRATLGQRLVDVASSDRHTVKPWLSARLDFSPPVHELALPGVVFLGGRVDYLDGRPVAALVYRDGKHLVNAFVWPTGAGRSRIRDRDAARLPRRALGRRRHDPLGGLGHEPRGVRELRAGAGAGRRGAMMPARAAFGGIGEGLRRIGAMPRLRRRLRRRAGSATARAAGRRA